MFVSVRGVNPMNSGGTAAIYLPGEGAIKSFCLALQLTKHLHTGDWVFGRLSPHMSLAEQFGKKLLTSTCTVQFHIFEMFQIEHFEAICNHLKFKGTAHLHKVSCVSEVFAGIEDFHFKSQKVYALYCLLEMHLNSDFDLTKIISLDNSGIHTTTYLELSNVHCSILVPWLL